MRATATSNDLEYGGGRIYESLHGFIHLTKVEKEIIDSPYFQRLRQVKQLGLAHLVFPGGEHTRFSHSLGVLWVIDRISRHLQFDPNTRQILRLAALLHDIGHFPLSHTIEEAYSIEEKAAKANLSKKLVGSTPNGEMTIPSAQESTPGLSSADAALHERMSQYIIEHTDMPLGITNILKKHDFEPNIIGSIVVGSSDQMLFNQLMHSDIDADQMDYLIRDATSLGIGYGRFDIEFLIECFTVPKDGNNILCIKEKGIHTVDHYLLAKYFYYVQILHHRTRWIIEAAAQQLYLNIVRNGSADQIPAFSSLTKWAGDPLKWISFDDAHVMSVFRQTETAGTLPTEIGCLFDIVLRRKIPICVYEQTVNCQRNDPAGHLALEACRKAMESAAPDSGTDLSATGVKLHQCHPRKPFRPVKNLEDRLRESEHSDKDELIKSDRDVIRICDKKAKSIELVDQNAASLASTLGNIETHVFRAYKIKPS